MKTPLTLTASAKEKIKDLIQSKPLLSGVRLKLRTRGCSGLSYVLEYVTDPLEEDVKIEVDSQFNLYIQKKALMFLIGTEMDYQENPLKSGFVFINPNEKGRCGCNASFHV